MTSFTTFDILKGAALIATFFGFLAMCAALVHWHDKTWKIAIEPTKASVDADSTSYRIGSFWNLGPAKAVLTTGLKVQRKGVNAMKTLLSIFALTLALAFTGPAFAGDVTAAKTEADCAKAGGTWNATTKMCEEKKM
jgi:hypothetical protein